MGAPATYEIPFVFSSVEALSITPYVPYRARSRRLPICGLVFWEARRARLVLRSQPAHSNEEQQARTRRCLFRSKFTPTRSGAAVAS